MSIPVSITVRHVLPEVRNELAARAAKEGKSMQEYLLAELTRLAKRPSIGQWFAETQAFKERHPVRLKTAEILRARDRDRR